MIAEGIAKERTYVVGSPMTEILNKNRKAIESSVILQTLDLKSNQYILLSAHREENIDNEKNFYHLVDAINLLAEHYQMPLIYSLHPRTRKMMEERQITFHRNVKTFQPFGFVDYNHLQKSAFCVISDSGTLAEKRPISNFPVVSSNE